MVENSRLVNMRPTSRWPRVLLVLVVAALLATMTGCGSTGSDPAESPAADSTSGGFPSATASPAPGLPVMELAGEPVVTCREPLGWPVSAMPDGVPGPIEDGELRDIFAGALDGPAGMEFEHVLTDGVDSDYRFLASTDDLVVLGLGAWTTSGPVRGAAWTATLELDGGEWDFLGFGDCQLERQYAEAMLGSTSPLPSDRVRAGSDSASSSRTAPAAATRSPTYTSRQWSRVRKR